MRQYLALKTLYTFIATSIASSGINMDTLSENIPPYEKFGFELLQRAFGKGLPNQWENDFARVFWQCLEINNGGFEQWIGNTGKAGVYETLAALQRFSLSGAHRITLDAFDLGNLAGFEETKPIHEHLKETLEDWFEKFRLLDEAYWEESERIHQTLNREYQTHVVELQ